MCSQSFTKTVPSSASVRSNVLISSYARRHSSTVANPSTRSTSTRPYQERSRIAMPPQPGSAGQKRHSQGWRSSSGVGAAYCLTRTWRGSSLAIRRLMAPPLPLASHPSSTTQSGGPSRSSPSSPASSSRSACMRSCPLFSRCLPSFLERSDDMSSSLRRPTVSLLRRDLQGPYPEDGLVARELGDRCLDPRERPLAPVVEEALHVAVGVEQDQLLARLEAQ